MKSNIELKQTRDFGEIISDCILFIRQNWKGLLKTYFVFCGFFIAGTMLFSLLLRVKIINLHNTSTSGGVYSPYAIFGLEYFMVIIFGFLNGISAILCMLSYIALYAQNGRQAPSISDVWSYYKYYFWRSIGHALLLFIIFFVAIIVVAIPVAILSASGGGANPFVIGVVMLICILVPILYFITVLSLFFPTVIIENGSFAYAFGKSFRLIKGKWWNTFGVIIVVGIIVYAGFLLVIIPFSILSGGTVTFISYNVSFPIVIIYTIMLSLCQVLNILPLTASAVTYFSYAEEKENIGLLERIDTLGKMDETTGSEDEVY